MFLSYKSQKGKKVSIFLLAILLALCIPFYVAFKLTIILIVLLVAILLLLILLLVNIYTPDPDHNGLPEKRRMEDKLESLYGMFMISKTYRMKRKDKGQKQ